MPGISGVRSLMGRLRQHRTQLKRGCRSFESEAHHHKLEARLGACLHYDCLRGCDREGAHPIKVFAAHKELVCKILNVERLPQEGPSGLMQITMRMYLV